MAAERLGSYEFDRAGGVLRHVATGQAIACRGEEAGGRIAFVYRDPEIEVFLNVEFLRDRPWNGWTSCFAFVDFNEEPHSPVRQSYGLWRRLAFFLLDSLSLWFFVQQGEREAFSRVELIGGWQNGEWVPEARLQARLGNPSSANPAKGAEATFTPFPLDQVPRTWSYVHRDDPALEVSLALLPEQANGTALLDDRVGIEVQVAAGPYFVRDDGAALIYHRYLEGHFHRGEDYDPIPYYGYLDDRIGFTFRAHSSYGADSSSVREMIVRSPETAAPGHRSVLGFWRLSADARERLMFALFDVVGVRLASLPQMPVIRERDRTALECYATRFPNDCRNWPGLRFGSHLHLLDGLPFSTHMGICSIALHNTYGPPREKLRAGASVALRARPVRRSAVLSLLRRLLPDRP